jgi:hypothetical protein
MPIGQDTPDGREDDEASASRMRRALEAIREGMTVDEAKAVAKSALADERPIGLAEIIDAYRDDVPTGENLGVTVTTVVTKPSPDGVPPGRYFRVRTGMLDAANPTPRLFQDFTDVQLAASRKAVADFLSEFGGVATSEVVRRIGEELQFGDSEVRWLLGENADV